MSSVTAGKVEQRIVHISRADQVDEVLKTWNAGGWRAIAISTVGWPEIRGESWRRTPSEFHWYILFERYV